MSAPETSAADLSLRVREIVEATQLAWEWHGTQTRKGKPTSYMSHLLQVKGMVIEAGGDATQCIAALLHDALEDAPDPAERAEREVTIGARFEPEVLRIVLDLTDTTPDEAGDHKGPWRERKERYLSQLRVADARSLLVAACDKRQNLGDLVTDLETFGSDILARFNAGPAEQIWYFDSMIGICRPAIPVRLTLETETLLDRFRALTHPDSALLSPSSARS